MSPGSAIYVFAILPQFSAPTNGTPSRVNLTYTLDQQPAGAFTYAVDSPNPSYSPSSVVFQRTGLLDTPHSLTVNVGPDSVLLLDCIVYSQENSDDSIGDSSSTLPTVTGTVQISPSSAPSQCVNTACSSGPVFYILTSLISHSFASHFWRPPSSACDVHLIEC